MRYQPTRWQEFKRMVRDMWLVAIIVIVFMAACGVDPRFAL